MIIKLKALLALFIFFILKPTLAIEKPLAFVTPDLREVVHLTTQLKGQRILVLNWEFASVYAFKEGLPFFHDGHDLESMIRGCLALDTNVIVMFLTSEITLRDYPEAWREFVSIVGEKNINKAYKRLDKILPLGKKSDHPANFFDNFYTIAGPLAQRGIVFFASDGKTLLPKYETVQLLGQYLGHGNIIYCDYDAHHVHAVAMVGKMLEQTNPDLKVFSFQVTGYIKRKKKPSQKSYLLLQDEEEDLFDPMSDDPRNDLRPRFNSYEIDLPCGKPFE